MPLEPGKSPKAFQHNIKAEMHAGKPQKQSLAIAYAIKRRNQKMAKGGMVYDGDEVCPDPEMHKMAMGGLIDESDADEKEGASHEEEGYADHEDHPSTEDMQELFDEDAPEKEEVHNEMGDPESLLDRQESDEKRRKMAKGGMILSKILNGIRSAHRKASH